MPKSRVKIEVDMEFSICCSNRNCPSHWRNRLTEKWKQSKLKTSPPIKCPSHYHLSYPEILSQLFDNHSKDEHEEEEEEEIYAKPMAKSILLDKHKLYLQQISKKLTETTYSFIRNDLTIQINSRMIALLSNSHDRIPFSQPLKINLLRINHIHINSHLALQIISTPIWNRSTIYIIVQDENTHCLRLAIYNWLYVNDTRQIKSTKYIQERLKYLLPLNSSVILFEPWLKKCQDGEIALRCDSPNTHFILCHSYRREMIDIEQLRQLGNRCYQADDNLAAIQFYTFGLQQLDEEHEKDLTSKGQSIGPKTDEREQHRIRFLSNRCACYLRERHAALALADTSILLSLNEFSHILSSSKLTTNKLIFRCLNAHLQLGLYEKMDGLLKSHQFGVGLSGGENSASITILEREFVRLKNEAYGGEYNLQEMLKNFTSLMFIDLPHHHAECQRNDLFQIRVCSKEKEGYGAYALQDLQPGMLLVVEQPFASIDNRITREEYVQSIHSWKRNSKREFCSNEILRLLNEVEKQLVIGSTTKRTLEKIQLMQPIRQWLKENIHEQVEDDATDLLETYDPILIEKNQWKKSLIKPLPMRLPHIPWRILFQTQQENPFKSQSTIGWYPLASMFNHSCLPNCLWYLIGDYLFLYVCGSTIRQGEELTISYCPLWISSINERAKLLQPYGIHSCQCVVCLYDRSMMNDYENELNKFVNLRALARQKNLSSTDRCRYFQQLNAQYNRLNETFSERPVGFIQEFLDMENIARRWLDEKFLHEQQNSFLQRLSNLCRVTLPDIFNPIFLFGPHIQLLIHHLEHVPSSDNKPWYQLLQHLYEIYTFKCHSSTTLKDYHQFFTNLFQTQTLFIKEKQILLNV